MSKVFIVTSGEYSDYAIDAVFSSEELAETFAGLKGGNVEQHNLNEALPTFKEFWVLIGTNGDVIESRLHENDVYHKAPETYGPICNHHNALNVVCRCETEAEAIKIAGDERVKWLQKRDLDLAAQKGGAR
jgi:hypothetical protein